MFASKQLTTLATVSAIATLFISGLSQAAPHPAGGRIGFTNQPGIERPAQVNYKTGRVDPGSKAGIYRHDGRKVENGRQG